MTTDIMDMPPSYITSTIPEIAKPLILELDGVMAQLRDGGIINAGGVSGNTFTVNGRALLFDDGTSTNGGASLTLQQVYNNTLPVNGEVTIQLTAGKDFKIIDSVGEDFFKIDAETGAVIVSGDFIVQGNSTQIDTLIQDSDHWIISPKSGTTTALSIRPDLGVTPLVDLVTVRRTHTTSPVFRIDSNGNLVASQNFTLGGNLNISGLINDVDIVALNSAVAGHLSGISDRHNATEVDILPIENIPGATTVQQALEAISIINNPSSGNAYGYHHIQHAPTQVWMIVHNRGTVRASVTVYDMSFEQIIPQQVHIIDGNTIRVSFGSAISGSAVVMLF